MNKLIEIFYLLLIIGIGMVIYGFRNVIKEMMKMKKGKQDGEIKNVSKRYAGIFLTLILGFVLVSGVVCIVDITQPGYIFQNTVHGHMENAYYADEPHLMKNELELCVEGMHDLNLQSNMYGAWLSWEMTPDKRMDYQYKHLNGIIQRIDAVIVWYEQTYSNGSTSTEQLGDVFEQKMDNLRGFLNEEGWSDWIAHDAYYINNYLWIYLFWIPQIICFSIIVVYGFYVLFRLVESDGEKIWNVKEQKWKWM